MKNQRLDPSQQFTRGLKRSLIRLKEKKRKTTTVIATKTVVKIKGAKKAPPQLEVNTLEYKKPAKKKKTQKRLNQDINIVICYNYNKKSHYSNLCLKPSKN